MVSGLLGLVRQGGRRRPASGPRAVLGSWLAGSVALVAALLVAGVPQPGRAQVGSARYASIVVDAATGNVLEAANADEPRFPASLTKLMTLYMAFEALRDHRISLDENVPVSWHTASMSPVKLGLVPGTALTVEQAMLGMVTLSANDAACALGELLGGDEDRFGQMMTLRARALGMTNSTFRNASGLPNPEQVSTARDLALLARHLIQDFPNEYRYFSVPEFFFHGRVIMNHDTMIRTYPGADGLKTGYTQAAGHNLVTSALDGGVRLIGVVMGAGSNGERDVHMTALLDDGFDRMNVPVMRRAPSPRLRMPQLIAAAAAAPLAPPPTLRQSLDTLHPPMRLAAARDRLARGMALRRVALYAVGPRPVIPTGGRAVHPHPVFERVAAQMPSPSRTAQPPHACGVHRGCGRLR
ncbi:MAG: D-alanyl-D-alanine carboxypeptidase family protein [Janthinobacterium lividum]